MSIEAKNWSAEQFVASIDFTNGIRVSGAVTVPSSNVVPVLVPTDRVGAFSHRSLELKLVSDGIGMPALTEKTVAYVLENAGEETLSVNIYYKDELIASIPVTR